MKGSIGRYGDTMGALRVRGGVLGFGFCSRSFGEKTVFFQKWRVRLVGALRDLRDSQ